MRDEWCEWKNVSSMQPLAYNSTEASLMREAILEIITAPVFLHQETFIQQRL